MQSISPGSAITGVTTAAGSAEHAPGRGKPRSEEEAFGLFVGGLAILLVIVFGVIKFKQWQES